MGLEDCYRGTPDPDPACPTDHYGHEEVRHSRQVPGVGLNHQKADVSWRLRRIPEIPVDHQAPPCWSDFGISPAAKGS